MVFETVADVVNEVTSGVANSRESTYRICGVLIKPLLMVVLGLSALLCAGILPVLPSTPSHPHHSHVHGDSIVATFKLPKPVSVVKGHVKQLESNLNYYVSGVDENTKVIILSVQSNGSYTTEIVFSVDFSPENSIPSKILKPIQSNFAVAVTRVATLELIDASLFGVPHSFEVVKFPGGITISPTQTSYPPEKSLIKFNFTLNHPILHIQEHFKLMKSQLSSGLRLSSNETLYLNLINSSGSTVSPPTIVETTIIQKVGVPVEHRRQQLVQSIHDSATTNLGLNESLFGNVEK